MNKEKLASLVSSYSVIKDMSNDDIRFLYVTIDILHTGKNLNGSYFDKSVVDSCIDTIKNTPVLGYIKVEDDESDFAGHEYIIEKTESGYMQKYVGCCYGVIPESCNPRWVTKTCSDNVEREFLQVDALLWEKFSDATSIVKRDGEKSQSMELEVSSIEGENDEEGIFHFTSFKFNGACILGEDVLPAMVDSVIKVNNEFTFNIQKDLNDNFSIFSKMIESKEDEQGGAVSMGNEDNKKVLDDNEDVIENNDNVEFSQTLVSMFEDICNIVSEYESITDKLGYSYPRYTVCDIQDDEVIVFDAKNNFNYYGFAYRMDNDKPVIDFKCGSRKKVRYENYEEGSDVKEEINGFNNFVENMNAIIEKDQNDISEYTEKISVFESKLEEYEGKYNDVKEKYDEYVEKENQRILSEISAEKDSKFEEYEQLLSGVEEFNLLKERKEELTVDDIEKECAVLYVKVAKNNVLDFSKNDTDNYALGVADSADELSDGYVMTKYGIVYTGR